VDWRVSRYSVEGTINKPYGVSWVPKKNILAEAPFIASRSVSPPDLHVLHHSLDSLLCTV
jgi:hypothetical protein